MSYFLRWHLLRSQAPNGGVEIIYRHCEALQSAGIEACPVHMEKFYITWFNHTLRHKVFKNVLSTIRPNDIAVIPEVLAPLAGGLNCRCVLFLQGTSTFKRPLELTNFESAIACSPFLANYLKERNPEMDVAVIPNIVDPARFHPRSDVTPNTPLRVLSYPRKHPEVTDALIHQYIPAFSDEVRSRFTLIPLEPSSQHVFATHLREADVFISSGYPEGFGLPPLQAMASGCGVIGFTGGGADGFMLNGETALVAPDGDIETLAKALERIVSEPETLRRLRANGLAMASRYTPEAMKEALVAWVQTKLPSV